MKDKYNSFTGKIIPGVGYIRVPNPKPSKSISTWKWGLVFIALAIAHLLTK